MGQPPPTRISRAGMNTSMEFKPGDLVRVRGREWVVLPELRQDVLRLRPLGGSEDDATLIYLPVEPGRPVPASFALPDPAKHGTLADASLLYDAMRLKLRAGAGPFRSFGNLNVEPRIYQLVPLLMALKLNPVRLLIADDVGIGKTIEAGLIARELIDRGEIDKLSVICPPHLCDQWQRELAQKFSIEGEVVRTGTAARLERNLLPGESIFEAYPYTIVSLDYIKSDRRYSDFVQRCPSFIIVDEAHTCVSSNTRTRHQRYRLVRKLAEDGARGMLLLTATPHSGDEDAFHNLLGLIDRKFSLLQTLAETPERKELREALAKHFVQRRRGHVSDSSSGANFPVRERKEVTYVMTGDWRRLFADVLDYARQMVLRAEGGTKQQQRMSWWAALALMRCISSSPAAALAALRTRLVKPEGKDEKENINRLDRQGSSTVTDEVAADEFSDVDVGPAGTLIEFHDDAQLKQLIARADKLRGIHNDPKIKTLAKEVGSLIRAGYRPIVFCRFIATAHYVGTVLRDELPGRATYVEVVTGELTSDQREERVEELGLRRDITPVLVATDCLSEGINLQTYFNAVVHYDLTWNPTRHEQREGRVDRFGQPDVVVRALMLYGENNPVDGAVLKVILRKAEIIQRELGIAVPLPGDNNKLLETIMRAALLRSGALVEGRQLVMDFGEVEAAVDREWQVAKLRAKRTVFAQRRFKPDAARSEWNKAVATLGGKNDVERFVSTTSQRLGAPLAANKDYCRLPVRHLPSSLQDLLGAIGIDSDSRFTFSLPVPSGVLHIHRSHPMVSTLADFVAERALDADEAPIGARCSATVTDSVNIRTTLYLLRLRSQIAVEKLESRRRYRHVKSLLAEECVCVEARAGSKCQVLSVEDALQRFKWKPSTNMPEGRKTQVLRKAIAELPELTPEFERIARERAQAVQDDHRRIRQATTATGLQYTVIPSLPVDVVGVHVFLPVFRFG